MENSRVWCTNFWEFLGLSPSLAVKLSKILSKIWKLNEISSNWSRWLVVAIYKGQKSPCDTHRVISSTNIIPRISASIILRCLTRTGENKSEKTRLIWIWMYYQIFTLQQVLEQRHIFRRPTVILFLDFELVLDSVDCEILWQSVTERNLKEVYKPCTNSLLEH